MLVTEPRVMCKAVTCSITELHPQPLDDRALSRQGTDPLPVYHQVPVFSESISGKLGWQVGSTTPGSD